MRLRQLDEDVGETVVAIRASEIIPSEDTQSEESVYSSRAASDSSGAIGSRARGMHFC